MIWRIAAFLIVAGCVPIQSRPDTIEVCDKTLDATACLDAGHYYASRQDAGRAVEMYGRACRLRLIDACIAGAKFSVELAAAACEQGYQPSCINAARYYDRDPARSDAMLDDACNRDPAQCGHAVQIVIDRDEVAAVAFLTRICAQRDRRAACASGASATFKDQAAVLEVARLGCAVDVAEACLRGGRIAQSPDEARAMLVHACELELPEGCVALGRLLSK